MQLASLYCLLLLGFPGRKQAQSLYSPATIVMDLAPQILVETPFPNHLAGVLKGTIPTNLPQGGVRTHNQEYCYTNFLSLMLLTPLYSCNGQRFQKFKTDFRQLEKYSVMGVKWSR